MLESEVVEVKLVKNCDIVDTRYKWIGFCGRALQMDWIYVSIKSRERRAKIAVKKEDRRRNFNFYHRLVQDIDERKISWRSK